MSEQTIGDLFKSASEEDRDLVAILVAAGVDDVDLSEDDDIVQRYLSLDPLLMDFIDFNVGAHLSSLSHSDDVSDFLEHYGVKGMRWGVRDAAEGGGSFKLSKSDLNTPNTRSVARGLVKANAADIGASHVAALKSKGHRVINGTLGDKTFWKNVGISAAVGAGAVAVGFAAPALIPASGVAAIGVKAAALFGYKVIAGQAIGSYTVNGETSLFRAGSTKDIGAEMLNVSGAVGAAAAVAGTVAVSGGTNLARAVRGNARIDKSFNANMVGRKLLDSQRAGSERTQKVLTKNGSLSKKDLKQSDDVGDFLAHYGVKGQRWGIRRKTNAEGLVSGGKTPEDAKSKAKSAVEEDAATPGKPRTSADANFISVDAERTVKTAAKDSHEMSDREILEAVNRARNIEQYNKMFAPDTNQKLRAEFEALDLQKKIVQMRAEMAPPGPTQRFISLAGAGFSTFQKVDAALQGNLSSAMKDNISKQMGLSKPLEGIDKLKADTELWNASATASKARVESLKALKDLNETMKTSVDRPSLAKGYEGAGKRRAAPEPIPGGGSRKLPD